jgi:hypothetical protein
MRSAILRVIIPSALGGDRPILFNARAAFTTVGATNLCPNYDISIQSSQYFRISWAVVPAAVLLAYFTYC